MKDTKLTAPGVTDQKGLVAKGAKDETIKE
jgi:hypothetical protein